MSDADRIAADRSRPSISVVIPLLNERPTIEELYERLTRVAVAVSSVYEIIFVDDGSTDGSLELIKRIRRSDPAVRFIRFRRNFGKSAALAAGFGAARYSVIATLDSDLQDLPENLPRLLDKVREGHDLVSGWRQQRQDPLFKRLLSRVYNWITSAVTGVNLHDINCGLKCYRREVLNEVSIYGERHRFIPVLASHRGFRLAEVKVEHAPRLHGASRYGLGRVFGGLFSLLTVVLMTRYTNKPLHFFGVMGLSMAGVGAAIALYLAAARLFFNQWLSNRPLFLVGTVLIAVGVQFIFFGLLAEMIAFSYRREIDYSILETSEAEESAPLGSGEARLRVGAGDRER